MEWYNDPKELDEAVRFILKYSCCYGWTALASNSTPCCNYALEDEHVPEGLKAAILEYYRDLSREQRRELNLELALLLGERFYVRESAVIKILSRLLVDGNPLGEGKIEMIEYALHMQMQQWVELMLDIKKYKTNTLHGGIEEWVK